MATSHLLSQITGQVPQAVPQRPVGPSAPGEVWEQRGAGLSLNSNVPGETFWECVLSSTPSPSRAYLDWDRRTEGDVQRCTQALRYAYLHRVCPVPGGRLPPGAPHHSVGTALSLWGLISRTEPTRPGRMRKTSLRKYLKWLERGQREEKVPVWRLDRIMRSCREHRGRISGERRGWRERRAEIVDEGQGASQEETTCDAGVVEMRRRWWGDESNDVGGGRAETSWFVTHLAGGKGHRLISRGCHQKLK